MLKASPLNILVNHPAYPKILLQYNELLQKEGKVNSLKFYREYVRTEIPSYGQDSWYAFLKRFKTKGGLVAVIPNKVKKEMEEKPMSTADVVEKVNRTIMSNQEATAKLISSILNISAQRALDIIENPQLLSPKEAIELGLKGMKAQDSRIHAVGKIREDNREQERFDKAFEGAAYGE